MTPVLTPTGEPVMNEEEKKAAQVIVFPRGQLTSKDRRARGCHVIRRRWWRVRTHSREAFGIEGPAQRRGR